MQVAKLDLLGGFTLRTVDGAEVPLPTRKERQLLAFLAMQEGRAQSRERLAALLWSDRPDIQARESLRQSLAALRRAFRSIGADPLEADRQSVVLHDAGLVVDALEILKADTSSGIDTTVLKLYRGLFLADVGASTGEFAHWVSQERERIAGAAERLVVAASRATLPQLDANTALRVGRLLVFEDPLLEPACRAVMRLCATRGDRTGALKAYRDCREALARDLGVEPDRETEDLYRDILTDLAPAPAPGSAETSEGDGRPRIAVLPLRNLTGNDGLGFLCEGLAEEISLGLGRFRTLTVIDHLSAAAAADATADMTEIGRRLGADLLVHGSIQLSSARLRIGVRLIDGRSKTQIWGDVFDCDRDEALVIPGKVISAFVATLHDRMEHAVIVQRRQDSSPAAYECVLRGIAHLRGYAPDDNDRAIALFRQALQIDPLHALAQAYLAFAEIVVNDFDASPRELLEDCKIRIDQALARDPADGRIHWLLANLHGYLGERDDERRQLERALEINPNDANAMISYGMSLAFSGRGEEGIATIREAMRLNPYHPEWYWLSLGAAFMLMRRFEDAIEAYKRRTRPKVWVLSRLAVCYAHLGRDHEAREMGRQILRQNPAFRISTLRKGGWPAAGIDLLRDGLRKAGLPE